MMDAPGCLRRNQYFQSIYGSVCHPTPETNSKLPLLINALKNDPLALPIPMFSNAPRPTLFRPWMSGCGTFPPFFSRVTANNDQCGGVWFCCRCGESFLGVFFHLFFSATYSASRRVLASRCHDAQRASYLPDRQGIRRVGSLGTRASHWNDESTLLS